MGNLYLFPYIDRYLEHLDGAFDVICWDRDGLGEEDIGARHTYAFKAKLKRSAGKWAKTWGYRSFRKFAQAVLQENDYDGVILLQTAAGILLRQVLRRKYAKRYVLDIRDYTMERNKLFYLIEKAVVNTSAFTVISSEGYKEFLPPSNYVVTNNDRLLDSEIVAKIRNRERNPRKLVVAYIGFIRQQEQQKRLLGLFKNDERFEFHYIGKEAEKLMPFCRENQITNVRIEGQFPSTRTIAYYDGVDVVNSLNGNNTPTEDYLLTNKLYFAAELQMPILVCPGTYMEKVVVGNGLGYALDVRDPGACDKLYDYYQHIDWNSFSRNCGAFLEKVDTQNHSFAEAVERFFRGE
jgi:hypothetical protein